MSPATYFAPLEAVTGEPVRLSMQRLWLTGQVLPAGARLVVQHVFRSDEEKPLEVIYAFPLPRDAAVRSFRITGEGFEAHSELRETADAVAAYEKGIARGSLAALVRQYGDGVMNLTVGNIRPKETVTVFLEILCGVELHDDGLRFRFPFTMAPAYHSQMRVLETAPGVGETELPPDKFGDMILPRFHADASALHQVGFDLSIVSQLPFSEIGSPSHTVRLTQGANQARARLAAEKDVPNRDLVLDAQFASTMPQVVGGRDHEGNGRFAAILPSTSFGNAGEQPRRVVILLDRSGSMQGEPITQAHRAIGACLGALSETDSFGLVLFNSEALAWTPELVPGTRTWRDKASAFLKEHPEGGGTELNLGFLKAVDLLGPRGGDILIFTDGQVSGTEEILAVTRTAGVRLHCLGIGSASQDRFLALLARESGGVSRFVTPGERVDIPAVDLFASIGRPVASGLRAGAQIQPEPPNFVFRGTPVLLFGETGQGEELDIHLTWQGGELRLPIGELANDAHAAETVRLLQGSRLITDWQSRYSDDQALPRLEQRKQNRIENRLLGLSRSYGLASREMSMVAVVTRKGDRPDQLPETRVVPVGMPLGIQFDSYFGGLPDGAVHPASILFCATDGTQTATTSGRRRTSGAMRRPSPAVLDSLVFARMSKLPSHAKNGSDDILLQLASRLEADGGMPGHDAAARALSTVIAVLAFLAEGHTPKHGAFRSHVERMVKFLKSVTGPGWLKRGSKPTEREQLIAHVIRLANDGAIPAGDWLKLTQRSSHQWKDVEQILATV